MFRKPLPPRPSVAACLCWLVAAGLAIPKDNTISHSEAHEGWLLLFDGESLFGWTQEGPARWRAANGTLLYDGSDNAVLRTEVPFSDFVLKFEFRGADPRNFGSVLFRAGGEGGQQDGGYLLQLATDRPKWPPGSIVPALRSGGHEWGSDQWHAVELEAAADHLSVKIDGRVLADGKDARSSAGYIALQGSAGCRMEFRNVKLKPLREKILFNGTDLSGWKAVNPQPPKPGALKKMLKAGGKPKDPEWSILAGAIHSEHGIGQLESQATFDDFLVQVAVRTNVNKKTEHGKTAIHLRGEPGQFSSGYQAEIAMPGGAGVLAGLKMPRKSLGTDNELIIETIVARGRHFQIWVDGYPVTEYYDTRAESNSAQTGARTAAGPISLQAPLGDGSVDFASVGIAVLPKTLGGDMSVPTVAQSPATTAARAPVPSQPAPQSPQVPAPASAPSAPPTQPAAPGMAPMVAQMQQQQAKEEANKKQVASLMVEALKSSDPKQQEQIYTQILSIDPNNMVAAQGLRDAQQKIQQAQAEQQQKEERASKENQDQANKQATVSQALQSGQSAFVAGDLKRADSQLAIADRIAPADPRVQALRARVSQAIQARDRVRLLAGGAGIAALLALIVLAWKSRGKKRPYLEVVAGMEKGKRFGLDQEVSHIGAVAQDGGSKNEIVVKDMDRKVSRFHCEIHKKNGKLFLIDRNSANGTHLNGKRVKPGKPVLLKNGAKVELARACALRVGYEKVKG